MMSARLRAVAVASKQIILSKSCMMFNRRSIPSDEMPCEGLYQAFAYLHEVWKTWQPAGHYDRRADQTPAVCALS